MEIYLNISYEKAKIAEGFNAETLIPNLIELMNYRQIVAKKMLSCESINKEHYVELFEYVNKQIKNLLAI